MHTNIHIRVKEFEYMEAALEMDEASAANDEGPNRSQRNKLGLRTPGGIWERECLYSRPVILFRLL